MTKDEARIVVLEDALRQAQYIIEFLHNCLVNPDNGEMKGGYSYESTLKFLKELNELCPVGLSCFDSSFDEDCPSCQFNYLNAVKLNKAHEVLVNK